MKKILLVSIPHTGTIFVSDFLEHVMGVKRVIDYNDFMESEDTNIFMRLHTTTPPQEYKLPIYGYARENCKVVSPIRHPYENAVSCFARKHSNLVFPYANWNAMIATAPTLGEIFWVDIDTEYRHGMMNQLCEFIERQPRNLEIYNRHIKDWKKVNRVSKQNKVRNEYNATGKLPNGPRYDMLDDAVAWYNDIKEKIDKQYALADGYGTVASNHSKVGSTPTEGAN